LLQVLQPLIDPTFSEHSYGFRPGRRAHDAVQAAQRFAQQGYHTVVDVDLSRFFDRVNHDILIDRLRKRIQDNRVIHLVRAYLNA
ncbi:reverse transcriptase domain-containing protein, partial [Bacillus cereus group sp. Bce040]